MPEPEDAIGHEQHDGGEHDAGDPESDDEWCRRYSPSWRRSASTTTDSGGGTPPSRARPEPVRPQYASQSTPRQRRHLAMSGNAFLLEIKVTPQFGRPAGPRPEAVGADESRVGTQPLQGACSPERAHKLQPLLPLRHSRTIGSFGRSRVSGAQTPDPASRQPRPSACTHPILSALLLCLSIKAGPKPSAPSLPSSGDPAIFSFRRRRVGGGKRRCRRCPYRL